MRVGERTGQRRDPADLNEIEAERAGQRRQMLERRGLGLKRGREEGAARGAAVAMHQQGHAAEIAADDALLLAGEDLQVVARELPALDCGDVGMLEQPTLQGREVSAEGF